MTEMQPYVAILHNFKLLIDHYHKDSYIPLRYVPNNKRAYLTTMRPLTFLTSAVLAAAIVTPASAGILTTALPYEGTPEWTDIVFGGTAMTTNGSSSTLTTGYGRGVWFGYGTSYGNTPGWSLGSPAEGNRLSLQARFSSNASEWSAYLYDGQYAMAMTFNPTIGCTGWNDCYNLPVQQGVRLSFGKAGNLNQWDDLFVALNTTLDHLYEFQLENGNITYRIDGQVYYNGAAVQAPGVNPLMVIGDGSGSSLTGVGSMIISQATLLRDPQDQLVNLRQGDVPEPAGWLLMLGGLGAAAFARRQRRN